MVYYSIFRTFSYFYTLHFAEDYIEDYQVRNLKNLLPKRCLHFAYWLFHF